MGLSPQALWHPEAEEEPAMEAHDDQPLHKCLAGSKWFLGHDLHG